MATDFTYEGSTDWTLEDQPDGLEQAATLGQQIKEHKAFNHYRLTQEHIWRWYNSDSSLYDPEAEGAHRPSAGRCHYISWTQFTGDSSHAPSKEYTKGKIVRIESNVGITNDPASQNGTVWIKKTSDGKWVPLIKQLRGLTWISGGTVRRPLLSGYHDHAIDQITIEDEDGVGDGATIDFDVIEPTSSTWNGYSSWTVFLYDGDWEHGTHNGGKEALLFKFGKYDSGDGGLIALTKEGITTEDASSGDSLPIDGVVLPTHNHDGSTAGGAHLSYEAIANTDGSRIQRVVAQHLSSGATTIPQSSWLNVGTVTIGEPSDSDVVFYELTLQISLQHTYTDGSLRELVEFVIGQDGTDPGTPIAGGCMFLTKQQGTGSMGSITLFLPSVQSGLTPTVNHGDTVAIYCRKPSGSVSATVDVNAFVRTWRR